MKWHSVRFQSNSVSHLTKRYKKRIKSSIEIRISYPKTTHTSSSQSLETDKNNIYSVLRCFCHMFIFLATFDEPSMLWSFNSWRLSVKFWHVWKIVRFIFVSMKRETRSPSANSKYFKASNEATRATTAAATAAPPSPAVPVYFHFVRLTLSYRIWIRNASWVFPCNWFWCECLFWFSDSFFFPHMKQNCFRFITYIIRQWPVIFSFCFRNSFFLH